MWPRTQLLPAFFYYIVANHAAFIGLCTCLTMCTNTRRTRPTQGASTPRIGTHRDLTCFSVTP